MSGGHLPRDAYHAERMYWYHNPKTRNAGELTTREVAAVLGIGYGAVRVRARAGKLGKVRKGFGGQLFFREKDIANVALAKELKK